MPVLPSHESHGTGRNACPTFEVGPGATGIVEHPTGGTMSPYASASGLAFQAFADAESLEQALDGFRKAGVVNIALRGEGLRKLAAPVYGADGEFDACLGLALPAGDSDGAEAAAQLREAAASLGSSNDHRKTKGKRPCGDRQCHHCGYCAETLDRTLVRLG